MNYLWIQILVALLLKEAAVELYRYLRLIPIHRRLMKELKLARKVREAKKKGKR